MSYYFFSSVALAVFFILSLYLCYYFFRKVKEYKFLFDSLTEDVNHGLSYKAKFIQYILQETDIDIDKASWADEPFIMLYPGQRLHIFLEKKNRIMNDKIKRLVENSKIKCIEISEEDVDEIIS